MRRDKTKRKGYNVKPLVLILFCGIVLPGFVLPMKKHVRTQTVAEEAIEAMLADLRITDDPEELLETADEEEAWCREQALYHYRRMRRVERCYNIKKLADEAKKRVKKNKTPKDK